MQCLQGKPLLKSTIRWSPSRNSLERHDIGKVFPTISVHPRPRRTSEQKDAGQVTSLHVLAEAEAGRTTPITRG